MKSLLLSLCGAVCINAQAPLSLPLPTPLTPAPVEIAQSKPSTPQPAITTPPARQSQEITPSEPKIAQPTQPSPSPTTPATPAPRIEIAQSEPNTPQPSTTTPPPRQSHEIPPSEPKIAQPSPPTPSPTTPAATAPRIEIAQSEPKIAEPPQPSPLPATPPALDLAYRHLQNKRYDQAVAHFRSAEPLPTSARKDLAYTLLKIGETEEARDHFEKISQSEPDDLHAALEYAFLCHETGRRAEARRIFQKLQDRSPAAREAFANIDRPLAGAIARWTEAIARAPGSFSAHEELARLAEDRDDLPLALEHYRAAWKLRPEKRQLLLAIGRVAQLLNQSEPAHAALLAASRGAEPHAAEKARELLGPRYPYVYEFRRAVELDPENAGLRRELGFLFLAMNQPADAEREFDKLVELRPDDLWAAAQLGLLRLAREDRPAAMPLLEKVLNGPDEELADRVREALKLPKTLRRRAEVPRRHIAEEAKSLAAKSLEKGYLQDAAKYLAVAHEKDPLDFDVMLKLGWTHNTLKDDRSAVRWFKLASNAPEPVVAKEAAQAAANLEPQFQRIRVSSWIFPLYSSRWKNVFNYSQVKTEFRFPGLPFTPYFSTRFVGDARGRLRSQSEQPQPQFLSETALIFALGVATPPKHGATLWAEAGLSVSYLGRRPDTGLAKPDYRGGLAFGKGWGRALGGQTGGLFFETNDDAVFVSRFQNDVLFYSQNRIGYTFAPLGGLQLQLYLNKNVTADRLRQYWANFAELGPGLKLRFTGLPQSMYFTANLLRGVYLVNRDNPGAPRFRDLRIGLWYAR